MSVNRVKNPLITNILDVFKKADVSQFELYSSVSQATTIIASDIAKELNYYNTHVSSVFGNCDTMALNKNLRIVARLRSGMPMTEALRSFFKFGNSSYIILDKTIDNKILYSSIKSINKFEKCIYCEPFLVDDAPIRIVIDYLISQGASEKNIILTALVTAEEIAEQLSRDYPNISIICGQVDSYFSNFYYDDKYYDSIGGVIFGDNREFNALKAKFFNL